MAGETREPEIPAETQTGDSAESFQTPKKPKHQFPKSQVGKLWEEFGNPEEPINLMASGPNNPAGGPPTYIDAAKSLFSEDSKTFSKKLLGFYRVPCARDALLLGIGVGFGAGGIRAVLGGLNALWSASNWAVVSFAMTSTGAFQFCQYRRLQEREGMKEAVVLMAELKAKRQREREEAKKAEEEAARAAEEERKRKSWTNLSNYKFW